MSQPIPADPGTCNRVALASQLLMSAQQMAILISDQSLVRGLPVGIFDQLMGAVSDLKHEVVRALLTEQERRELVLDELISSGLVFNAPNVAEPFDWDAPMTEHQPPPGFPS